MNKLCCLIGMFITCGVCEAQNLVPNGDFELYSNCPVSFSQLTYATGWMNPTTVGNGTPDYFNSCSSTAITDVPNNNFGYQHAQSGNGYVGIYMSSSALPDYREFFEVQLTAPLIPNNCYHFQMFINLSNSCKYTSKDIGVYFSDTAITGITNYNPLPFIPQLTNTAGNEPDTLLWTPVNLTYTAAGGENFMIIGNFIDDANFDTVIFNSAGVLSTYFYIDNVSLSPCTGITEHNQNQEVIISSNPFTENLSYTIITKEVAEIILYDISSRKLLHQQFMNSVTLNTVQLAKGIYLYEVRNKNGVIKKGKIVKN